MKRVLLRGKPLHSASPIQARGKRHGGGGAGGGLIQLQLAEKELFHGDLQRTADRKRFLMKGGARIEKPASRLRPTSKRGGATRCSTEELRDGAISALAELEGGGGGGAAGGT